MRTLAQDGVDPKDRTARGRRPTAGSPRRGALLGLCASLLLFFLGGSPAGLLSAEGLGSFQTVPPLSTAFPLVQQGTEVHVAYPVAINEEAVVRPDARLHFLYMKPRTAGAQGREARPERARRRGGVPLGVMGLGGMGIGGMHMGTTSEMPPETSRNGGRNAKSPQRKIDRSTVWRSTDAFRKALSGLDGSALRLVFSLPAPVLQDVEPVEEGEELLGEEPRPQPRRIRDEPLVLPLGLLLAQRKGAPTVLAVEEGSEGERAGFRAKDRIVSLNGSPAPKSLSKFLALYRQEKARGLTTLTVRIERAGNLTPLSLVVPLSPHLTGSALGTPGE